MNDFEKLQHHVNSGHTCISIVTHEEPEALSLVMDLAMETKRDLLVWSAGFGIREGLLSAQPPVADTESPDPALVYFTNLEYSDICETQDHTGRRKKINKYPICVTLDLAPHLKNDVTLRLMRDAIHKLSAVGGTLIMIDASDKMPDVVKTHTVSIELSYPNEKEISDLVRATLRRIHQKTPIEIGITKDGMKAIIRNLRGLTRRQAEQIIQSTVAEDKRFDDDDVNHVMAGKRQILQGDGLLEYIETPLTVDQIGGMDNLKKWLKQRKDVFKDKASEFGLTAPRGVLMLGVQGAGKSLCAKAIAAGWQLPLLRMDPGALYNSFIGQSEQNLRKALRQAEQMSPVILWVDEIEKAFASASSQSSDGGLSKRMFGTLLTWMQDHKEPVFMVATANDIEALPPELLRKGRFDEIFFVGLPKHEARKKIFEIHLKKRQRNPQEFDLVALSDAADGYSGAEIEQAVISALYNAFYSEKELSTKIVLTAVKESVPLSVTMAEKIQDLYEWAEGRCVPAD